MGHPPHFRGAAWQTALWKTNEGVGQVLLRGPVFKSIIFLFFEDLIVFIGMTPH